MALKKIVSVLTVLILSLSCNTKDSNELSQAAPQSDITEPDTVHIYVEKDAFIHKNTNNRAAYLIEVEAVAQMDAILEQLNNHPFNKASSRFANGKHRISISEVRARILDRTISIDDNSAPPEETQSLVYTYQYGVDNRVSMEVVRASVQIQFDLLDDEGNSLEAIRLSYPPQPEDSKEFFDLNKEAADSGSVLEVDYDSTPHSSDFMTILKNTSETTVQTEVKSITSQFPDLLLEFSKNSRVNLNIGIALPPQFPSVN